MTTYSTETIRSLRKKTGAGVMDCKRALEETKGDEEQAILLLREWGKVKAGKKADREAGEGRIGFYVHTTGKVAALVALRCETDFVARGEVFETLVKDLAMQVVAMNPTVVRPEDVPEGGVVEEHALLAQQFVKDQSKTVQDRVTEVITELGENIIVEQFAKLEI